MAINTTPGSLWQSWSVEWGSAINTSTSSDVCHTTTTNYNIISQSSHTFTHQQQTVRGTGTLNSLDSWASPLPLALTVLFIIAAILLQTFTVLYLSMSVNVLIVWYNTGVDSMCWHVVYRWVDQCNASHWLRRERHNALVRALASRSNVAGSMPAVPACVCFFVLVDNDILCWYNFCCWKATLKSHRISLVFLMHIILLSVTING